MSRFRVETVEDAATGMVAVELYHPADAVEPFQTTPPIYRTYEEAEAAAVELLDEQFPGHRTITDLAP